MTTEKETYSFTKLSAFHTCKYGYYMTYIQHSKGIGNCFSSYGSEVHSIMERYAKGKLPLNGLPEVYAWEFDTAVPERFPTLKNVQDLRKTYFEQGKSYLEKFKGYDDRKILGVEEEFMIDIDDWSFRGFIDLVYEQDGKLVIQDYKSKKAFKGEKEQKEYARQMYLYSLYVKQKYGRNPDMLRFEMFRSQKQADIPFDESELQEALEWATNTVKEIRKCWDYTPTCDLFFSQNLCNHREYCTHKI